MAACAPTPPAYGPPEASGLVAVRPYPAGQETCFLIGESPASADFLDHMAVLIGCPVTDQAAIAARRDEGARLLRVVGEWVLLSQPLDANGGDTG